MKNNIEREWSILLFLCNYILTRGKIYVVIGHKDRETISRRGVDSMPFPPGVGGGRSAGDMNVDSYEVITADRALDETNVGNRMLRNMGWQEGSVPSLILLLHMLCVVTYLKIK